jgi:serine/threonine-protein kinase
MTLSPDGTRLVFVSQGADGIRRLFTRRLDESKVITLSGTEGASAPFFSPDGQWVGFFARGKLKKARIDSGESVTLCDAPQGRGGTWGDDGNIIASLNTLTGLSLVPSEAGTPTPLTELDPGEYSHRWPQVLPGGKAVLFSVSDASTNFDEADVAIFSLKDHRRKAVLKRAGMYPRFLPSGHLVYVQKGWLFAVPFDPDRLEVRGVPIMLAQVSNSKSIGFAEFDGARGGTLAYRMGGTADLMTVAWLDGAGSTEPLLAEAGTYNFLRLSPDGDRLAFTMNQGANTDLFVYDLQRGSKTRLTNAGDLLNTGISNPVWSADSRFVVFRANGRLFYARAEGGGRPELLTDRTTGPTPMSLAPDGTLAYSQLTPRGGAEIRTLQVETQSGQLRVVGESRVFLKTSTADVQAAFSPDGHWLAYADAIDGDYQVYVRAFPDRGTRVQVSSIVGMVPRWSATGHELFYRTEDHRVMVVNYSVKGESFTVDKPREWSEKQLASTGTASNYDVALDGKRLIGLVPTASPEPRTTQSHIMIATNIFEEIRQRVAERGK